MGFNLSEKSDSPSIPIFQKVLETVRGGLTLDTSGLTAGDKIVAGTPMTYDEATRLAKPATYSAGPPEESDAKGLLYEDITVPDAANQVQYADIVVRGTVYKNRIPSDNIDVHAAGIPLIIFSESF